MSGCYLNVSVSGPSSDVTVSSYESFCAVDPFRQPERLLDMPLFAQHYWRSLQLALKYVTVGMLPGRVPVRDL